MSYAPDRSGGVRKDVVAPTTFETHTNSSNYVYPLQRLESLSRLVAAQFRKLRTPDQIIAELNRTGARPDVIARITEALSVLSRVPSSTPIDKAVRNACTSGKVLKFNAVKTLLDHRVIEPCQRDIDGNTVLHYIAFFPPADEAGNSNEQVSATVPMKERVKVLLDAGATIDSLNDRDESPLELALRDYNNGMEKKLRVFLDAGADIERVDRNERSLLFRTAETGNMAMVSALMNFGARSDRVAKNGDSLLHAAAKNLENPDVIRLLAGRGAKINARNRLKETPLHVAVLHSRNDPSTVIPLLEAGANPALKDRSGKTPKDIWSDFWPTVGS